MENLIVDFGDGEQKQRFIDYIKTLNSKRVIHLELPALVRNPSIDAYYFGFLLPFISKHTGHTVDELHDHYVREMLPTITFRNYYMLTTADMSETEQMAYIRRIKHDFQKHSGFYIPDIEKKEIILPGLQDLPNNAENFERK